VSRDGFLNFRKKFEYNILTVQFLAFRGPPVADPCFIRVRVYNSGAPVTSVSIYLMTNAKTVFRGRCRRESRGDSSSSTMLNIISILHMALEEPVTIGNKLSDTRAEI